MLESIRGTSAPGTLQGQRATAASRANRSSSQSFASRFSAALSSSAETKSKSSGSVRSGMSAELARSRTNSVTAQPHVGRNLLEIPMDQPVAVTKAQSVSLYGGPQDKRDGITDQAGKVTAGGAPSIIRLTAPVANQWGYTGEAAFNPYFTTPSNPLRDGLVAGFSQWFEGNHIGGLSDAQMNVTYSATQEGAQEALRLVQQYDAGATLGSSRFGASGGPWLAEKDTREIVLSNGTHVNAGLLLGSYYNQGQGVTARSDQLLQVAVKS
jgi:hypothetical protein